MPRKFLRDDGWFQPVSGGDIVVSTTTTTGFLGFITNSVTAGGIALNSTATTFDGPSVAQGTSGIWYASGTITILQGGVAGTQNCKLWDGTTVVSAGAFTATAGFANTISLSGAISAPAGNLKISVLVTQTGTLLSTFTTNINASTLTAVRIG